MRLVYFTHSLTSCWNNGNAHFLRGVLAELIASGHDAVALQPRSGWSLDNLLADHGPSAVDAFHAAYPELKPVAYGADADLEACVAGADVVIAHEWNEPRLVGGLGRLRARGGRFTLLFHDTHHRAVSDPGAIGRFDLDGFDAVLAFGEALAAVYRREGWGRRVHVWHEAADTRLFRPPPEGGPRDGVVWIGNWGDEERSEEIAAYLLRPAARCGFALDVHGVRYPESALAALSAHGARYRGWLPNAQVPTVLARYMATVHVPRRLYVARLPGIPTIRVFEALACGIPLVSAPWEDAEGLFRPGADFLMARDPAAVERYLSMLRDDGELCKALAASGLATIRARHTCRHRAGELVRIIEEIRAEPVDAAA
ncbi:MAG: glycosyltransferase [Hyphomicrobiaceae bacterium]|nr:glycosyltransferase [Hyphomicrobiaceae bacterium]